METLTHSAHLFSDYPPGAFPAHLQPLTEDFLTLDFCLGPARKTCHWVPPTRWHHFGNQCLPRKWQSSFLVYQGISLFKWWVTSHLGQAYRQVPTALVPLLPASVQSLGSCAESSLDTHLLAISIYITNTFPIV